MKYLVVFLKKLFYKKSVQMRKKLNHNIFEILSVCTGTHAKLLLIIIYSFFVCLCLFLPASLLKDFLLLHYS